MSETERTTPAHESATTLTNWPDRHLDRIVGEVVAERDWTRAAVRYGNVVKGARA